MANIHEVQITTRILPTGQDSKFKIAENASLLAVLEAGAEHGSVELLPPNDAPLDKLHNIEKHGEIGPAIDDLEQTVGEYIKQPHTTHNFGLELVRAFRVNTRWDIATASTMTPRQILALPRINLDFQTYTLYRLGSADPLPLDTAIEIERGTALEAQPDGKYGA
jgi:hypothetical protein